MTSRFLTQAAGVQVISNLVFLARVMVEFPSKIVRDIAHARKAASEGDADDTREDDTRDHTKLRQYWGIRWLFGRLSHMSRTKYIDKKQALLIVCHCCSCCCSCCAAC
jgi:hypothetical protein